MSDDNGADEEEGAADTEILFYVKCENLSAILNVFAFVFKPIGFVGRSIWANMRSIQFA